MTTRTQLIFLGFCERAAYVRDGNTNIFKWNVLGLKHVVLSNIFPLNLNGLSIGLAISPGLEGERKLQITDEAGNEIGTMNLATKVASSDVVDASPKEESARLLTMKHGWTPAFFPLRDTNMIVQRPGRYLLKLISEESSEVIGDVSFVVVDPPPLTPERIAAIRSEPQAYKSVRIELGCKKCPKKIQAYAAIERSEKLEKDGWNWYKDIPAQFVCDCGITTIDLTTIQRNLHGLLGNRPIGDKELSFIPMYERTAIESIRTSFYLLLKSHPREEVLQKFIEGNPILLHQLPAEQIFFKPSVLTFFVADFAIVTPQKELILIEIEKTNTPLMKKDGGSTAALSHAFDQVRDWLLVVDDHRLAILDSLGIDKALVSSVRGVVIAGRDKGYDVKHLRRLKGTDFGRIAFLTYDDLLFSLDLLISRMGAL